MNSTTSTLLILRVIVPRLLKQIWRGSTMGHEVYTELGIYSETLSLDELNSIIGIACDKGWNKGDLRLHTTTK
jgi:hypothetical protein